MTDQATGAYQIAEWLGGIAVAGLGWVWRQISAKASKEELADAVRDLREQHATMLERVDEHYEEAKESRERLYSKVDDINKTLGATMVTLSHLQGKFDRES